MVFKSFEKVSVFLKCLRCCLEGYSFRKKKKMKKRMIVKEELIKSYIEYLFF